jgi:hypothetical protein
MCAHNEVDLARLGHNQVTWLKLARQMNLDNCVFIRHLLKQ